MSIAYAMTQMVGNVGSWTWPYVGDASFDLQLPGQHFTSEGRSCGPHTCEQGCIEPANTITTTLGDLAVLNNDVGNDAEDLSTTEGVSTTEDNAKHDVSDHRASVMFNAGDHSRSWILAAATADHAQETANSAEDVQHAVKPTSVQQRRTTVQVALRRTRSRRSPTTHSCQAQGSR